MHINNFAFICSHFPALTLSSGLSFRSFRAATPLDTIQGRRSFVACPWLLHFAPLALGENADSLSLRHYFTLLSLPLAVKRIGMLKRWILSLIIVALASIAVTAESEVPASRLARLRHGINLSHWFAQSADYSKAHLESHTTAEDIALIRKIGFDHVRLTLEPAPLFNADDPSRLTADYLSYLDHALDMILAQELAVIVDIHPSDEFKKKLNSSDRQIEAFGEFWRALAQHLSPRDPERASFEVINEP